MNFYEELRKVLVNYIEHLYMYMFLLPFYWLILDLGCFNGLFSTAAEVLDLAVVAVIKQ